MCWQPAAALIALTVIAAAGCGTAAKTSVTARHGPDSCVGAPSAPKGVQAVICTPGDPLGIGVGFGSVWVTSHNGTLVYRISPATNKIIATLDTGHQMCGYPAAGYGRMWVPDCDNGLTVINPATNRIIRWMSAGALSIGFGAGSVWAGPRIDPATLRTRPTNAPGTGANLTIAFADGSVWWSAPPQVVRVDPATGKILAVMTAGVLGSDQNKLMFAAGKLWVYPWIENNSPQGDVGNEIWRIDPRTNTVTKLTIPHLPAISFTDFTAGMGSLWVRGESRTPRLVNNNLVVPDVAYRLDPRTLKIIGKYPGSGQTYGVMIVAFGSLWLTNKDFGTVWRYELA
jgi:hypothetical protein